MSNDHLTGNNTHVANATDCKILAKVDENDQEIKSLEHAFGLGGSFKGVELNASYTRKYEFYERMKGLGYIEIKPNQLFAFPSNNPHVSVFFKTRDGEKMLCSSVKVNPDKSVIVTKQGLNTPHVARCGLIMRERITRSAELAEVCSS